MDLQGPARGVNSRSLVREEEESKQNGATNARRSTKESVTEGSLVSNAESLGTMPMNAPSSRRPVMGVMKKGTF